MDTEKRIMVLCFIYVLYLTASGFAGVTFKDVTNGIKDANLNTIAIDPQDKNTIYVGSSKGVYKTTDGGKSWKGVLSIGAVVNFIVINPSNPLEVYAATNNGLYKTTNAGNAWKKVFSGAGEGERNILCVALNKSNNIYAGTKGGIFVSLDNGENWQELAGRLSNLAVRFIAIHPTNEDIIYSATSQGVFKSNNAGKDWERVFVTQQQEEVDVTLLEDLDELETDELTQTSGEVRSIYIDPASPDTVYLASSRGIYVTQNGGSAFKAMEQAGIQGLDIKFITASEQNPFTLYAATDKGVFEYSSTDKKWNELYKGLTTKNIRMLALDNPEGGLWLATSAGVFKSYLPQSNNDIFKDAQNILSYFVNEPTIKEIQDAAIRYGEVHPEKISSWRKEARLKALMPELSTKLDNNVTDLWDWETGSTTTKYDNVLNKGKEALEWEVSLSWDLGDFIWSTDQTSIDVRSRLMVQLRDDILNEATRLYFERRRLQVELLTSTPKDTKTYLEKELRLQELTADIDGLTGGYLSKKLNEMR